MDPPSWTEIIGLLTISLGWAEFFRRISEDRKRNFGGPQAEFRRTASGISEDRKRNFGGPQAPEAETQEAQVVRQGRTPVADTNRGPPAQTRPQLGRSTIMTRSDITSVTVFALGAAALALTDQPPLAWALMGAAALGTAIVAARAHRGA